jgi:hypothetical protein
MDQNVISNFKLYYLRRTFKELVEETDGKDKQSIRDLWKTFDIMKGIKNIVAAWKKLWLEACNDFRRFEDYEAAVANDIVELANQRGMDDVDIDNVQELLQSQQKSLTNEELVELEQQRYTEDDDDSTYDDVPNRNLTIRVLTEGINMIMDVLDLFTENDADIDRSTAVKRVVDAISCYKELLRGKLRARQSTLNVYFKKEDVPQPGPSSCQ